MSHESTEHAHRSSGIVFAMLFDGRGGGRKLSLEEISQWKPGDGALWVHVDFSSPGAEDWLRAQSGLDTLMCDALLEDEARPRAFRYGEGLLLVLRGMNFNPGAEPHDMIVLRGWFEPARAITIRRRKLVAPPHIADKLGEGRGPRDVPDLLVELCELITERMSPVIEEISELTDDLDKQVVTEPRSELRSRLMEVRTQTIALRRYLAPQRDALARLQSEPVPWLTEKHRAMIRETADSVTRYVEEIDEAQNHIAAAQDQLAHELADNLNRNMYRLSILAAIFIPLSLVTSLLGINVAGIPGAERPVAFLFVCVILLLLGGAEFVLFRWMKWL